MPAALRFTGQNLAPNLLEEIAGSSHRFEILPRLGDLLKMIKTPVSIPDATLADALMQQAGGRVTDLLSNHGFLLGKSPVVHRSVFATENPAELFVDFSASYPCEDARGEGRTDARLTMDGDGTYDSAGRRLAQVRALGEKLTYKLPDGTERLGQNAVGFMGAFLGHRDVTYTVRYKLD